MVPPNHIPNKTDLFVAYFRKADLYGDGQISGAEAVAFFQGSNLHRKRSLSGHFPLAFSVSPTNHIEPFFFGISRT